MPTGGDVIPDTVFRQMSLTAVDLITEDRTGVFAERGRLNPDHAAVEFTKNGDV